MNNVFLSLSRVLSLFVAIVVVSVATSSTITNIPAYTKSYQLYTEGKGEFTDKYSPSVTVEYGVPIDPQYNTGFWSLTNDIPYDGEGKILAENKFEYDSKKTPWSGTYGQTYKVRAKLYEMQMGPKVMKAQNMATIFIEK